MAEPISFDPATINQSTTGNFSLGQKLEYLGKWYEFVKLTDAVNGANGMVTEAASGTDGFLVTVDRAGGSSLGRIPRGVLVGTVTAGNYCFQLIDGLHSAVKDAAANLATVGLKVTTHAVTDGDATVTTAYTDKTIGTVYVVSAAGVAGVMVQRGV